MHETAMLSCFRHSGTILAPVVYAAISTLLGSYLCVLAETPETFAVGGHGHLRRKINFIAAKGNKRTLNPAGWEAYDGSVYAKERGYGWTSQLTGLYAGGEGEDKVIRFPGGEMKSPRSAERLELATWQGAHQENQPLVFRIDLPNGWYRVGCASVAHADLPVIDQRNFNCRAQDS